MVANRKKNILFSKENILKFQSRFFQNYQDNLYYKTI